MVGQRRSQNRDPHPMFRDAISVTRFWSLVDKRGEHDCWPWLGDFDKDGYGVFFFNGKRWADVGGPIERNRAQYRKGA